MTQVVEECIDVKSDVNQIRHRVCEKCWPQAIYKKRGVWVISLCGRAIQIFAVKLSNPCIACTFLPSCSECGSWIEGAT